MSPIIQQHDHDDGLVHGHAWAMEPPRATAGVDAAGFRPDDAVGGGAEEPAASYDDGLVHEHGWACSERGQMAAR
jgi:hypothetical protein